MAAQKKAAKLQLPIIKDDLPAGRPLTMDEYFAFVQFNLKNIDIRKNREAGRDKYAFRERFKL